MQWREAFNCSQDVSFLNKKRKIQRYPGGGYMGVGFINMFFFYIFETLHLF